MKLFIWRKDSVTNLSGPNGGAMTGPERGLYNEDWQAKRKKEEVSTQNPTLELYVVVDLCCPWLLTLTLLNHLPCCDPLSLCSILTLNHLYTEETINIINTTMEMDTIWIAHTRM